MAIFSSINNFENFQYDETSAFTYSAILKTISFQNLEVIFESTCNFSAYVLDILNPNYSYFTLDSELYLISQGCMLQLLPYSHPGTQSRPFEHSPALVVVWRQR